MTRPHRPLHLATSSAATSNSTMVSDIGGRSTPFVATTLTGSSMDSASYNPSKGSVISPVRVGMATTPRP